MISGIFVARRQSVIDSRTGSAWTSWSDLALIQKLCWLGLVATLVLSTGCAGHSAKTLEARAALDRNNPENARDLLNKELKVKGVSEIPAKEKKGTPLLVLDRSAISQSLRDYKASSSDLQYADKKVEMLDMSRTAVADIGKYLFSDDTGPYKAPPYEKVMINTVNMQNYLAAHDMNGARVEARRMSIIQDYLKDNKNPAIALNAPGSYLAGFVFERSGRADIALRYYDEALALVDFQTLAEPVLRLSAQSAYSTDSLRKYIEIQKAKLAGTTTPPAGTTTAPAVATTPPAGTTTASAVATTPPADDEQWGDVLIMINYGRIPAKVARRIPIGLALTFATAFMSAASTSTANRLAAQGLVTWVNFPDMEESKRTLSVPEARVDGLSIALEGAAAIDLAARNVYEQEKGRIMAAAITRLIARVVAGEAAGAAARAASNDNVVGALVSVATQATLVAADTPDTRSWSMLPARMAVARLRLPPGEHTLEWKVQGTMYKETFVLDPGGWHAGLMTVLR